MTFRTSAVVLICCLLGLCCPVFPQDKKKSGPDSTKIAPPNKIVQPCGPALEPPKAVKAVIDLCPSTTKTQAMNNHPKEMELRYLKGKSIWVEEHADILLSKANKEQVAWTCNSQDFKLVSIVRIQNAPLVVSQPAARQRAAPQPAEFPFCNALERTKDAVPQPKGTTLYSGPPEPTAVGCYKYSFILANGITVDPHLIITDPTSPYRQARPKCDFGHRTRPDPMHQ